MLCLNGVHEMCGLCGLIGEATDWTNALQSSLPKRRERLRKIKILNLLIVPKRLTISDFHGMSYMVQTPTGRSSLATGLNQLFSEIESLSGQKIDVLGIDFLEYLETL